MDNETPAKPSHQSAREARLKLALRENLKRRKSQARGRSERGVVTPEDDARESANDVTNDKPR